MEQMCFAHIVVSGTEDLAKCIIASFGRGIDRCFKRQINCVYTHCIHTTDNTRLCASTEHEQYPYLHL